MSKIKDLHPNARGGARNAVIFGWLDIALGVMNVVLFALTFSVINLAVGIGCLAFGIWFLTKTLPKWKKRSDWWYESDAEMKNWSKKWGKYGSS